MLFVFSFLLVFNPPHPRCLFLFTVFHCFCDKVYDFDGYFLDFQRFCFSTLRDLIIVLFIVFRPFFIILLHRVSFSHQPCLIFFYRNLSDSKSTKVSRTLLSILANFSNVVNFMVSARLPISNSPSPLTKLVGIVLKEPITIGDTDAFWIVHITSGIMVKLLSCTIRNGFPSSPTLSSLVLFLC